MYIFRNFDTFLFIITFKVCVGASIVDVQVFLNSDGLDQHHRATYLPARIVHSAGGVARNHADALSRLGCEVTLLSALGTENGDQLDVFGQFLVDKTRGIVSLRILYYVNHEKVH